MLLGAEMLLLLLLLPLRTETLRNGCKCELSVNSSRAETPGFEIETAVTSSTETTTLELLLTTW
jgi:hypothetical protein